MLAPRNSCKKTVLDKSVNAPNTLINLLPAISKKAKSSWAEILRGFMFKNRDSHSHALAIPRGF